jgi:hypothetical protein
VSRGIFCAGAPAATQHKSAIDADSGKWVVQLPCRSFLIPEGMAELAQPFLSNSDWRGKPADLISKPRSMVSERVQESRPRCLRKGRSRNVRPDSMGLY